MTTTSPARSALWCYETLPDSFGSFPETTLVMDDMVYICDDAAANMLVHLCDLYVAEQSVVHQEKEHCEQQFCKTPDDDVASEILCKLSTPEAHYASTPPTTPVHVHGEDGVCKPAKKRRSMRDLATCHTTESPIGKRTRRRLHLSPNGNEQVY